MQQSEENFFRGFHVSGDARDLYQFELDLFAQNGKANINDFHAARTFAQQMNQRRDLLAFPEQAVRAGQINAVALIHGISQYVFRQYYRQIDPNLLHHALDSLDEHFGQDVVDDALTEFIGNFPPTPVYIREIETEKYLVGISDHTTNRELMLEELLLLWVSNANPAFSAFFELFGDDVLEQGTIYPKLVNELYQFFQSYTDQESDITGGENIIDVLLAPARAAPHSLEGQLSFILSRWSTFIGSYVYRLLRGMDLMKEEEFKIGFGGPGPIPLPVYDPAMFELEAERFTPDREWMPNLVLIAKNAYVWLDQLSKKYKRPISRLDQIPDEELDMLARWGFTGLWLIGLWERSKASKTVKQLCGNPDAVASAYSLFDYQIAEALGGEAACHSLQERAWQRGIRIASDMVPNHVGIDGKWVIEHPEWFVSLPYSPFPSYTFNGIDLSWDQRVGIYLEDHYYDRTDAAVVFKRVDRWTGDTRFIYHGNDGTSMPWNDTAQLNYLNPEVREAMIQLILRIARQFPVIRFDAAMTLVKRHYHRLWFPEPGSGGAIPSRAEHGLTKAQFDAAMPEEFWRELVDRAAIEAPDTLLLAEAFWLMEGYFVRSLGMHRVYNSAFMNILRDEENAKYRSIMKNTLEFDPEILRRYVNFMNNPDERTAVDQFGKGDKYFGICALLVTMPGLPMFGHGQVEGFAEKYGMEYQRAYWDEQPDQYLIQRHEREIFPLMRKRYLFAGVEQFLLFDFFATDGQVNENVFAYSNRVGEERALVVYHNRFASASGWIRTSTSYLVKTGQGDERKLVQRTLGEGLGLSADENAFVIFRDSIAGLEYIRSSKELYEQGLYIELGAYQYHVFFDFRTVRDDATAQYRQLTNYLTGRGVPNINDALQELFVQPILAPFREIVNADVFRRLIEAQVTKETLNVDNALLDEIEAKTTRLLDTIQKFLAQAENSEKTVVIAQRLRNQLQTALQLTTPNHPLLSKAMGSKNASTFQSSLAGDEAIWGGLFGWLFVHALGEIRDTKDSAQQSRSWVDEWLLGRTLVTTLREIGIDESIAGSLLALLKFSTSLQNLLAGSVDEQASVFLNTLLQNIDAQHYLRINRYQDILWFDKEAFERLTHWLLVMVLVAPQESNLDKRLEARHKIVQHLQKAASTSSYQVERLRAALANDKKSKATTAKR
jgi:glycosidase